MTEFRPSGFQRLPNVVKNIIIINVLMVLIQFVLGSRGIDLANYLGLHYWSSRYFHWWQIITHMFMHGTYTNVSLTVEHIFFNMFAFWMFGSILENIWGSQRFLMFYLICGVGAALCHMGVLSIEYGTIERAFHAYQMNPGPDQYDLFLNKNVTTHSNPIASTLYNLRNVWLQNPSQNLNNESITLIQQYLHGGYFIDSSTGSKVLVDGLLDEATVGASGAVFGVLFAFGYLFPNTYLYLFFAIPIKAKWVVAGYIFLELYEGLKHTAGDNVAHFAHLGGVLFAFILLKIWNNKIRNRFY